ncbi:MAG: hypothetical protein HYR85_18235 [Planctomycetes bacterium]|nr:hypothetical protein [Planctomycetota bacterium]
MKNTGYHPDAPGNAALEVLRGLINLVVAEKILDGRMITTMLNEIAENLDKQACELTEAGRNSRGPSDAATLVRDLLANR